MIFVKAWQRLKTQMTKKMLERVSGEGNIYLWLVRLQTDVATMENSIENSQMAKNKSTMVLSYTAPWHMLKGLHIYRHLLIMFIATLFTIQGNGNNLSVLQLTNIYSKYDT